MWQSNIYGRFQDGALFSGLVNPGCESDIFVMYFTIISVILFVQKIS